MSRARSLPLVAVIVASTCASCGPADEEVARRAVEAMIAACPVTDIHDEGERDACAEQLAELEPLRDVMASPFVWGGQSATDDGSLEGSHTTRFNPFVWRKLYLSLMMFPGDYTMEQTGDRLV